MAETMNSIFNKRATEKLRSPDDLDKYVRVTNPSVWVVLVACIALLAGLLMWGVFGAVTTSVSATGAVVNRMPICFLNAEDVAKVRVGDSAVVGNENMVVSKVARIPMSHEEAHGILESDYLVSTLLNDEWDYAVIFEGDGDYDFYEGVPLSIRITVERVSPISLILRNRS
ncbi:MAG TPA: hypothetical protein DCP91_01980 [Eggerthellaceae bacterium]|nr:hypothetical protein [Eggerthellaceae bacterium]